jgi:uncharacterized protein
MEQLNMRSQLNRWPAPAGLALGGLVTLALPFVWAVAVEPRLLDETQVDVRVPGLPPTWDGERVAALGDFQIGVWWANVDTSRRAIKRVVEARPAALLLLGDFLYHPAPDREKALAAVSDVLQPLAAAGIPAFAVLGNHDYGLDDDATIPPAELASDVARVLSGLGITVLEDAAVKLPDPKLGAGQESQPLYLAGVGSHNAEGHEPTQAVSAVPEGQPRIVMMHNPHSFRTLPARAAPVAVAGHTHGAQVRIPFLPGRSWLARYEGAPAHTAGWAGAEFGQPGNNLYVNRGIGFSGLPLRFGARPELTFMTLFRA